MKEEIQLPEKYDLSKRFPGIEKLLETNDDINIEIAKTILETNVKDRELEKFLFIYNMLFLHSTYAKNGRKWIPQICMTSLNISKPNKMRYSDFFKLKIVFTTHGPYQRQKNNKGGDVFWNLVNINSKLQSY